MATSIDIQPGGIERYAASVKTIWDPTLATPQFAVTETTDTPEESDFFNGDWLEEPVLAGTTWKAKAVTPRIGDTGADIVLEAGNWSTWMRIELAGEVVLRKLTTRIRMKAAT